MDELKDINLTLVAFGLLPGFISIQVFSLLQPSEAAKLKDSVLEAIAFGLFNFVAVSAGFGFFETVLIDPDNSRSYATAMFALLAGSILWPVLLYPLLRFLARTGLILRRDKNSWDEYFRRKEPCWIIVHLKDGRKIGGWFGTNSYASTFPNSGHLYIEILWRLDESGNFIEQIDRSRGIILRPDDYLFVEFFEEI